VSDRLKNLINLPLHQYLGVVDITSNEGSGVLTAKVNENTTNPLGVYHGGVTYTLCDVCAYAGMLSLLGDDEDAVTHDMHVSIMRSARAGEDVVFKSTVLKKGRNLCFMDVEAKSGEKTLARARITKSILQVSK